jgi:uncharacterized damage-inducible protein DinB
MSEVDRIMDQIQRAWAGDAWHGPPLRKLLADVSAQTASAHPIAGAHSIAEIVMHLAFWKEAGRRRLAAEKVLPSEPEQWPPPRGASEDAWKESLALLDIRHKDFMDAVASLSEDRLAAPVAGKDYNQYVLLHGLIQHDLYHAGQIALLKRAAVGK